jgi:hypothetical protein
MECTVKKGHAWTRWEIISVHRPASFLVSAGTVEKQERCCIWCGLTQRADIVIESLLGEIERASLPHAQSSAVTSQPEPGARCAASTERA